MEQLQNLKRRPNATKQLFRGPLVDDEPDFLPEEGTCPIYPTHLNMHLVWYLMHGTIRVAMVLWTIFRTRRAHWIPACGKRQCQQLVQGTQLKGAFIELIVVPFHCKSRRPNLSNYLCTLSFSLYCWHFPSWRSSRTSELVVSPFYPHKERCHHRVRSRPLPLIAIL